MHTIFFIAGRTGGPFFPLPSVIKNLDNIKPVIIGIKGGFEERASLQKGWKILFLPDTRLTILTFKKEKLRETIKNYFELAINICLFGWSILKSLYFLLRFSPKMIYSTGSFLAVPMTFAAKFTNFLRLTNTKIVVHQQDPLPGLSNRLTVKYADLVSCVFDYTKSKYPQFSNAKLVPNPIDTELYDEIEKSLTVQNSTLKSFLNKPSDKPLLLIFGGGSGSEDINVWTIKNLDRLLTKFRIIHLTGLLQKLVLEEVQSEDYLRLEAIFEEMPYVMKKVDLVLCRAGMASITELLYLQKPAFLVPLPHTHQEKNAEMVKDYFYILDQKDRPEWADTIFENYPKFFSTVKYLDKIKVGNELKEYYGQLQSLLDKN